MGRWSTTNTDTSTNIISSTSGANINTSSAHSSPAAPTAAPAAPTTTPYSSPSSAHSSPSSAHSSPSSPHSSPSSAHSNSGPLLEALDTAPAAPALTPGATTEAPPAAATEINILHALSVTLASLASLTHEHPANVEL
nr:putative protein TPRXL [Procambarus clarkii]